MNLGLTGGIACGKSTVLSFFRERGIETLSSDAIVGKLYVEDLELLEKMRGRFGDTIFNADGVLVRKQLANIVFEDALALAWLEGELHPRVGKVWQKVLKDFPEKHHVIEIPLLFEKKLEKHFNYTLCITAHRESQYLRLKEKGWTAEHVQLRMARQMSLDKKTTLADFVICNDGSLAFLSEQMNRLMQILNL